MSVETLKLGDRAGADAAQEVISIATALEDGVGLSIDASAVEHVDGPAVIALANVARVMAERGQPVEISGAGDELISAFNDLGLYGELMKMEFRK